MNDFAPCVHSAVFLTTQDGKLGETYVWHECRDCLRKLDLVPMVETKLMEGSELVGEKKQDARNLEVQVRELWDLLRTVPAGPGEGMVSEEDYADEQETWSIKLRAAMDKWKPKK